MAADIRTVNRTNGSTEVVPQGAALNPGSARQFNSFRFSVRRVLIFVAEIGVLFMIPLYIIRKVERVRQGVRDHYALTEVTEMISHHFLRRGKLPSQSDEMRHDYAFVDQGYGLGPAGFDELRRRVIVNFELLAGNRQLGETEDVWFIRVRRERRS
jgi:hypothetical protein